MPNYIYIYAFCYLFNNSNSIGYFWKKKKWKKYGENYCLLQQQQNGGFVATFSLLSFTNQRFFKFNPQTFIANFTIGVY